MLAPKRRLKKMSVYYWFIGNRIRKIIELVSKWIKKSERLIGDTWIARDLSYTDYMKDPKDFHCLIWGA
jgi:hypothetical protein